MMTLLPLLRCSHCAGDAGRSRDVPAAPATGDASLQAGSEVTNPDMANRAKTRKQKSGPVDAGELSSNYSPSFHILRWVKQEVAWLSPKWARWI
jgi:hypothetical protein